MVPQLSNRRHTHGQSSRVTTFSHCSLRATKLAAAAETGRLQIDNTWVVWFAVLDRGGRRVRVPGRVPGAAEGAHASHDASRILYHLLPAGSAHVLPGTILVSQWKQSPLKFRRPVVKKTLMKVSRAQNIRLTLTLFSLDVHLTHSRIQMMPRGRSLFLWALRTLTSCPVAGRVLPVQRLQRLLGRVLAVRRGGDGNDHHRLDLRFPSFSHRSGSVCCGHTHKPCLYRGCLSSASGLERTLHSVCGFALDLFGGCSRHRPRITSLIPLTIPQTPLTDKCSSRSFTQRVVYRAIINFLRRPALLFLQTSTCSIVAGFARFSEDFSLMLGRPVPIYFRICIQFAAPVIITVSSCSEKFVQFPCLTLKRSHTRGAIVHQFTI